MDQNEMQLVAHFRLLLRKGTGDKVDLVRFSNDVNYAKEMIGKALKAKNEELVNTALKIMKIMGVKLDTDKPSESDDDNSSDDQYVGRLR